MGKRVDLDMEVLKQVRDEVQGHRGRFNALEGRMDQLEGRMDRLEEKFVVLEHKVDTGFEALGRRVLESEMRTATAITALSGQVGDLVQMLKDDRNLRQRVERCEADISVIKTKLPK
jgi:phage shock protein A